MAEAAILAVIIVYIGFRNWLNHDRRRMLHRERLAAIEKGMEIPAAVEQESGRRAWNVQRFLLLSGWCWIAVGIGGFLALQMILSGGSQFPERPPQGAQYAALIPIGIGVAHLITYWNGERHDSRAGRHTQ